MKILTRVTCQTQRFLSVSFFPEIYVIRLKSSSYAQKFKGIQMSVA